MLEDHRYDNQFLFEISINKEIIVQYVQKVVTYCIW